MPTMRTLIFVIRRYQTLMVVGPWFFRGAWADYGLPCMCAACSGSGGGCMRYKRVNKEKAWPGYL